MLLRTHAVQFYQDLIDRGWRRSGDYVYQYVSGSVACRSSRLIFDSPDMARTCCPQYTIRLESLDFKANKKHRQVINRFNRYLATGQKPGEGKEVDGKGKGKEQASQDWIDTLRANQVGYGTSRHLETKHRFEVRPCSCERETARWGC